MLCFQPKGVILPGAFQSTLASFVLLLQIPLQGENVPFRIKHINAFKRPWQRNRNRIRTAFCDKSWTMHGKMKFMLSTWKGIFTIHEYYDTVNVLNWSLTGQIYIYVCSSLVKLLNTTVNQANFCYGTNIDFECICMFGCLH